MKINICLITVGLLLRWLAWTGFGMQHTENRPLQEVSCTVSPLWIEHRSRLVQVPSHLNTSSQKQKLNLTNNIPCYSISSMNQKLLVMVAQSPIMLLMESSSFCWFYGLDIKTKHKIGWNYWHQHWDSCRVEIPGIKQQN